MEPLLLPAVGLRERPGALAVVPGVLLLVPVVVARPPPALVHQLLLLLHRLVEAHPPVCDHVPGVVGVAGRDGEAFVETEEVETLRVRGCPSGRTNPLRP